MKLIKKIGGILILSILLFCPEFAAGEPIDLAKNAFFVRKGFSDQWLNLVPVEEHNSQWKRLSPQFIQKGKMTISNLDLAGIPKRRFFSIKEHPLHEFTFLTCFELTEKDLHEKPLQGLYLRAIGINWEVYLNGKLLRKEMHMNSKGVIQEESYRRFVRIGINPLYFKEGLNVVAFRIVGDPTCKTTGFYSNRDYIIDDYDALTVENSEIIKLILMAIYLFIGIYHLFLFFNRMKQGYNFFYGFFSVFLFMYLLSRTATVFLIIPDSSIVLRLEYASVYSLFPFLGAFIDLILNDRITKFVKLYSLFCTILAVLTLFMPVIFIPDLLVLWQATAPLSLLYVLHIVCSIFFKDLRTAYRENNKGIFSLSARFFEVLRHTVAGNLFLGIVAMVFCAFFDIYDTLFLGYRVLLTQYAFFMFEISITLILTNRFLSLHNREENLNRGLQQKIDDLNEVNTRIIHSEEKYRILVEGSNDVIFSLDENLNFITANKAISSVLDVSPIVLKTLNFLDLVYAGDQGIAKEIVRKRLEVFTKERKKIRFSVELMSLAWKEPKEVNLQLEYLDIEGKNEILGKISTVLEDSLIKYFVSEKQNFVIGNYLVTVRDIVNRITRNLRKYIDPQDINYLRLGLREVIINAIEHGNLGITYSEKTVLMVNDEYFEFLAERQDDPAYQGKKVLIEYVIDTDQVQYRITDEGLGFDHKKLLSAEPSDLNQEYLPHGRGLEMVKNIFDSMVFNEIGNEVVLVKRFE
ncbi:MAG: hypothetical protein GY754_35490 [bacterium]|nr:hypothetical protein [bacterium]